MIDVVARWASNQFSIPTSRVSVTESREYENDLSLDHVRSLEVFLVDDPSLTAGLPDGATLRVSLAAMSKTFEGQSLFEVPWRVRSGPLRLRGLREGAYAVTCSGWPLGDAEAAWHFSDGLNAVTPAAGDARVQYAPGRQVTK